MYLFREFTLGNKELHVALQSIYGVGWSKSYKILSRVGLVILFFYLILMFIILH